MMVLLSSVDDHAGSTEAELLFKHRPILMGRVTKSLRIAAHSPKVAEHPAGLMSAPLRKEISGVLDVQRMVGSAKESRVSNPEDHIAFMDLRGAGSAA